jgi:exopolyphosphatase / guanosine-5'-triphosphate,3'-diphosphate pyrophosphatase
MRVAIVDVGSNTVRLLVARAGAEGLEPVVQDKAYLGLGAEIARTGAISAASVEAAAAVCESFAARARELRADEAEVIVTAPGRQGRGSEALIAALRARTRLPVRILSADSEGLLAYEGAVASAVDPLPDSVGVVDVGGGSTELVVGNAATGARWVDSVDLGSLRLTRLALPSDPPSRRELDAARALVREAMAPLAPPTPEAALAVGGSARALAKLVGRAFDADDAAAAVKILSRRRSTKVARDVGIDPRRAGTVLAGALLLGEASRILGRPLSLGRGGIREGAALALARAADADAA